MLKVSANLFRVLLLCSCAISAVAAPQATVLDAFKQAEETRWFFEHAYGYAVFPSIAKGGIIIGGAYGKGDVYRHEQLTGNASLAQLSIGWQWGAQAYSEIIFFEDEAAYNRFISGHFAFNAEASAVVITIAGSVSANTQGGSTASAGIKENATVQARNAYTGGMAVFTAVKGGLMYQATIGGQKFSFTPLESL